MKQAEKFNRPVICFVDTPGAFCGLEAEERGQGEAIARNLFEMSSLRTPILSIVIGDDRLFIPTLGSFGNERRKCRLSYRLLHMEQHRHRFLPYRWKSNLKLIQEFQQVD